MSDYFRLYSHIYYIYEQNSACIYNTITGDMISINPHNAKSLKESESNTKLTEINNIDMDFYSKLNDMGLGTFYNNPVYVEKAILGISEPMQRIIKQNYTIRNMQVELTSDCNLDCKFCPKNDNTLFRKTGCKRWNIIGDPLEFEEWKNIISQVIKLGCKELTFIGGEPMLEYQLMRDIIKFAQTKGIYEFTIYTNGTLLDIEKLKFIYENNVKLILQLLSIEEDLCDEISGYPGTFKSIFIALEQIKNIGLNFSFMYLVNRFNELEVNNVRDFTSKFTNNLVIDYIYPKPQNEFYSKKYANSLYNTDSRFIRPKLATFQYFKNNNCCYGDKIAITQDGNVLPCIMSRQIPLGNIRDNTNLYSLLNSKYYKYKRMSKDSIDGCSKCALRYGCIECRALEMSACGEVNGIEYCNKKENTNVNV